ncbi:hypothetical protein SLA2020_317110 [Shorea laevis]
MTGIYQSSAEKGRWFFCKFVHEPPGVEGEKKRGSGEGVVRAEERRVNVKKVRLEFKKREVKIYESSVQ